MAKTVIYYDERCVVDPGQQGFGKFRSPSWEKPRLFFEGLAEGTVIGTVVPCETSDFDRVHNPRYVQGVSEGTVKNGYGNTDNKFNQSLRWTNGAMVSAALGAAVNRPTCAPVSGFHHAGYDGWEGLGYFCTFNGLLIAGHKLMELGKRTLIVDCDMHHGNGTDDILESHGSAVGFGEFGGKWVRNITFGRYFGRGANADLYLSELTEDGAVGLAMSGQSGWKPDVVIYQAGADVHVDDPHGGVLGTQEMFKRDMRMFELCQKYKVPVAWCLAGGYQVPVAKVMQLHFNTLMACNAVYGCE